MIKDNTLLVPEPGPAHKLLGQFAGRWRTSGNMKSVDGGPDLIITGTDTYTWLPGGFFIKHVVDVMIGEERKQATEIIGFDPAHNNYLMHYFDNQGNSGVMYASEHHGIWTFASDTLRFTGAFNDDGSVITGIWEYATQGEWELLMDIKLSRDTDAQ